MPPQHLYAFAPGTMERVLAVGGWLLDHCEPAAYSRSYAAAIHRGVLTANGFARRVWAGAPIFTKSFNVVARPA